MPTVKGSKQQQMIVVPLKWWHGLRGQLLVCLLLSCTAVAIFWSGSLYEAGSGSAIALFEKLSSARMTESSDAINSLREQLAKAEQAASVDKLTQQDLRVNIQRLRQQISQLEEDVLFYKQITNPDAKNSGLSVSAFDLMATPTSDHYRYKIKFEKTGNPNTVVEGYANIAVTGVKDDMDMTLPLSVLSNSSQGENIRLRFRLFQDVEGEISLPYGFEPARVEILVVTEEPESKTLQKNFSWLVESGQKPIGK
jgi:hypothetical protein